MEKTALLASLFALCWLIFDSFLLERAQALDPEARHFFRSITEIGRPRYALILLGLAIIAIFLARRSGRWAEKEAALRRWGSMMLFGFIAVAGASTIAGLVYGIVGRARPRLHDLVGPIELQPMSFHPDYSSFPSHHAAAVFAVATAVALLAPRLRVLAFLLAAWLAATRFLISTHYFSDALAGALIGIVFTWWLAGRFAARHILFERDAQNRLTLIPDREVATPGAPSHLHEARHEAWRN